MAAPRQYPCPSCPASFSIAQELRVHWVETHEGAGPSNPPEPTFKCQHCRRSFNRHEDLVQHLLKSYECSRLEKAWLNERVRQARAERAQRAAMEVRVAEPLDPSDLEYGSGDEGSVADNAEPDNPRDEHVDNPEVRAEGEQSEDGEADSELESNLGHSVNSDDDEDDNAVQLPMNDNDEENIPQNDHAPQLGLIDAEDIAEGAVREVTDEYGHTCYIQDYPVPTVGEPIRQQTAEELAAQVDYPQDIGELSDPHAFEIAKVLLRSNITARYRKQFFRMTRLLGHLPWEQDRYMMKDVDKLPRGAKWTVQGMEIKGENDKKEIVELWMRNALVIVKRLLRNKRLGKHIRFKPEIKWTTAEKTDRIRDETWTADLMWQIQGEIEDEYGTVITIIISSDETRLTNFSGDKKAHPVYITIGNLPKRLRRRTSQRANVLLGYLPVPKLDFEPDKEKRRFHRQDLFHKCMKMMLEPLQEACKTGVEVPCADGAVRRIYPVLASYVADFPEQCRVACCKTNFCPLCTVHPDKKGDLGNSPPRTRDDMVEALEEHRAHGSINFVRWGMFEVDPFWKDYPYVRLDCLMSPDLLHQMHKGVMKDHLTKWLQHLLGSQKVDERHTSMPEYHGMRHFKNGISTVSQWTGRELKEMVKVLLPIMADVEHTAAVKAGRALMDFLYLAHSSSLTDSDLADMEQALRTFHENKQIFRQKGCITTKKAFHGIPKIHMMQHYVYLIKMLGTPDGYNTETSERLHIDFAKMGYRASNKVNAIKQMAVYIQRMEALAMHEEYLEELAQELREGVEGGGGEGDEEWDEYFEEEEEAEEPDYEPDVEVREAVAARLEAFAITGPVAVENTWAEEPAPPEVADQGSCFYPVPEILIATTPTTANVTLNNLSRQNGAPDLRSSLNLYLWKNNETVTSRSVLGPEAKVNTWSRVRLLHSPPPFKPSEGPHVDVVRAQPAKLDRFERLSRPARYDVVLIPDGDSTAHGINRYRPARVRAIFKLSKKLEHLCKEQLVFVDLFNVPSRSRPRPEGLHTTTRTFSGGIRTCAVYPLTDLRMTVHLAPRYSTFRPEFPLTNYSDVLQLCATFHLNIFATYFLFELFRHWRQDGAT
ncbi:C2H2 zinc finger [Ceratobasidium sp. AG-Ba]|nr:C2H2 zinc finger [Ceratobasidium sp. AG-Ba]